MPDNPENSQIDLTRRKILGSLGAAGAAGAATGLGTSALFSDEEGVANNILEAGEFDLKVDWEVEYYNGLAPDPETISDSDTDGDGEPNLVDDPGPIVDLQDVKPGDVIEHTLSLHLFGNPGFITMDGLITADSDAGITEPEDQVDGALDDADGTPDGDLDDHLQCVVWYDGGTPSTDPGNNFPEEITNGYSPTNRNAFIDDLIDGNVSFDATADEFILQGTFANVMAALSGGLLLDPQVNGHVAGNFPNSQCFAPSTTQYIGVLCWLPRDIPGVDDNIVQSDRLEYELGFNANQCRNNIANNGRPDQRPTGGVQPLTFEVTEGYGTLDGGPFDLQSDVGFPENLVTSVDTSADPVEFVLDVPEPLDKSAGDQWSLVFDADNDGTVDFRVIFDEFFYQEWGGEDGWGNEEPVPDDIDTGIVDGIYIVRIPRDRLSDPFAFAGRVCYGEAAPMGEDFCVSFTPDFDPTLELGESAEDFVEVMLQEEGDEPLGACCDAGMSRSCEITTKNKCTAPDKRWHEGKDCAEICKVNIKETKEISDGCEQDDCHKFKIAVESDAGIDKATVTGWNCDKVPSTKTLETDSCPQETELTTPCVAAGTPVMVQFEMCCSCVSTAIKTISGEEGDLPAKENKHENGENGDKKEGGNDDSGVCCDDNSCRAVDDIDECNSNSGEHAVGGEDCGSVCAVKVKGPFVVAPCPDDDDGMGGINNPGERAPMVDEDDDCGVLGYLIASKAGVNKITVDGECDKDPGAEVFGRTDPYTESADCETQVYAINTADDNAPHCFQQGTEVTLELDLCCGCGTETVKKDVPPVEDDDSPLPETELGKDYPDNIVGEGGDN